MNQNVFTAGIGHVRVAQRRFLRDVAVFQLKLMLDGLRDFVLLPVSLFMVLIDLLRRDGPPGRRFYETVHFARETEQWIDLFEAAERAPGADRPRPGIAAPRLDEIVDDIESRLRAGYENGDLSASALQTVEHILQAAKRTMSRAASRS